MRTTFLRKISGDAVSDELFAQVRRHFDEKSLVDLTLAIIAIDGWNRLALPFRSKPGSYQPKGANAGEAS